MERDPARGTVSKTGLEEAITDKTEDRQSLQKDIGADCSYGG